MNPFQQKYINIGLPSVQEHNNSSRENSPDYEYHRQSLPSPPAEELGSTAIEVIKKENEILKKEIHRLFESQGSRVISQTEIEKLLDSAKQLHRGLDSKYSQAVQISEKYKQILKSSKTQNENLRNLIDNKIVEINANVRQIRSIFESCAELLKSQNFEIIKKRVNLQIHATSDKLNEFETMMQGIHQAYRARLEKILGTRRQAEVNFMEERKRFMSVVAELEKAYLNKEEFMKQSLSKRFELMESNYLKLKHENGKTEIKKASDHLFEIFWLSRFIYFHSFPRFFSFFLFLGVLLQKNQLLQTTIEELKKKSFEENSDLSDEKEMLNSDLKRLTSQLGGEFKHSVVEINEKIENLSNDLKIKPEL